MHAKLNIVLLRKIDL